VSWVVVALLLGGGAARAEPVAYLRFAGIAPEGTAWAREAKAFAREIESASGGRLAVRMYLGGIAGDDREMGRRMRRDQLDGALSAGVLCEDVAPSLGVFRIPGLVQDRGEASYVLTRLYPALREEARAHGFILLGAASLGRDVVAARERVDSLEKLRKLRLWQWDLDHTAVAYSRAMGLQVVALPVSEAGRAYEEGRIDGFLAIPSAILGSQWFTKQLYLSQLPLPLLHGCVVMSAAAYDRLPTGLRDVVQAAAAKLGVRFAEVTGMQDAELLGGLLARQGVRSVPVTESFRVQFLEASRAARDRVAGQMVAPQLLAQVQAFLADYRSLHH
jgi:TRAP-type transport system periplasmic protein